MEKISAFLDKAKKRLKEHERIRKRVEHSDFYELALEACSDAIGELQKLGISDKKLKSNKADIDEKGTCRTRAETIIKNIEARLPQ